MEATSPTSCLNECCFYLSCKNFVIVVGINSVAPHHMSASANHTIFHNRFRFAPIYGHYGQNIPNDYIYPIGAATETKYNWSITL